jgi:nucleotide-binding universal stress UspA family protein
MANGTIVVGVDESDAAHAALEWAVAESKVRGNSLHIIHVFPVMAGFGTEIAPEYYPQAEKEAEAELQRVLAGASEVNDLPDVKATVIPGGPAQVLVEQSQDAEMLVLGHRGKGGFAGLNLGSVSAQCARHARCPVVIIR